VDNPDGMVIAMDEERRRAIMAEARAHLANRHGIGASDIAPDLGSLPLEQPAEPTRDDLLREAMNAPMEDPIARWKQQADEREAAREQAKADLRRQERRDRELVRVEEERKRFTVILATVLDQEQKRQRAELAEAEARIIAEAKAEFAKMLAVVEAKIEGRFSAIEPWLDRLAEVRAEVSRFREELLGQRRIH
jgi:hypothetical protein